MAGELILDTCPLGVLAEDLGTDRVFTLDRQDFSIFRLHGSRPFRLLP